MQFRLFLLYLTIIVTTFGVISLPSVSFASPSDILVGVVPPNPSPHEQVRINLNSYAYNLDSVLISWSVDGKTIASGIGKKLFSLTAPASGSETMVLATIYLPDGAIETKIPIRPSIMVLLWQATDSYVPPFYRGKAMPTPDSEVRVVAIPEIKIDSGFADPKNMTYYWKKDYTNNVDGSGYGKNFFKYVNDYLEDSNNISVTASTIDDKYSSQSSIYIGMVQPKILFYTNTTKLGTLWDKALADGHKIEGSEVIEAVPYFMSPKQILHPALKWSWFINDTRVQVTELKRNLMPLKVENGASGNSILRLNIDNKNKIFQNISKEINVSF